MVITRPTLTNLFWPATTLSMFTLQPRICRRDANTCHLYPRRPYCHQQAPRPTFCARLTITRTSSLALPLPTRFSSCPSGDLLSQTIHVRSFLQETTVPLFFGLGRAQDGLTCIITFTVFFVSLFLLRPYSRLQI